MKEKEKIHLLSEDKENVIVGFVQYDKEERMKVLNKISLNLGAECERYNQDDVVIVSRKERKYPLNKGYEIYRNEDPLLSLLLDSEYQTYIHSDYFKDGQIWIDKRILRDAFCFYKVYNYLNGITDKYLLLKYREATLKYLDILHIDRTSELITKESYKDNPRGVATDLYYVQKKIATANEHILSLGNKSEIY